MEYLNKILDKYFNGETSVDEENILKLYFKSDQVAAEHLAYKPLFDAFKIEASETMAIKQQSKPRPFFLQQWIYAGSGVAAAVLLALWLFGSPLFQGDYAIVNGTRINDHELALQIAQSKINKVRQILGDKLQPLESIQTVKNSLKPAKKMGEIKTEINNIKQMLILE